MTVLPELRQIPRMGQAQDASTEHRLPFNTIDKISGGALRSTYDGGSPRCWGAVYQEQRASARNGLQLTPPLGDNAIRQC